MSYWQLANDIESISFRLNSIKSIIEMVAENINNDHESGALWGCGEMLEVYAEKLEKLANDAMELHKIEKEDVAEKATLVVKKATKGKKK